MKAKNTNSNPKDQFITEAYLVSMFSNFTQELGKQIQSESLEIKQMISNTNDRLDQKIDGVEQSLTKKINGVEQSLTKK